MLSVLIRSASCSEALLMSTHNLCFREWRNKKISMYSLVEKKMPYLELCTR